jgi:myo-inositol-1(or 4)-monophosphatase
MDVSFLKSIGEHLLQEIPALQNRQKTVIGIGAAGDKTYKIDKVAEDIILAHLRESSQPLTVVSEEIGVKKFNGGGKKVLIDPVDGSRNAVAGIPFYCTSITVIDGDAMGDIELGYVINLTNGDVFWAERNKGAFLNDEKITTQQDDIHYLTAYEAQTPSRDIPLIMPLLALSRKTRCLGATALDLSYLASGSVSIFITPAPSRSFDFAAGLLIVKEAGGIVTDMEGNPIESIKVSLSKSTSLLAAGNRFLHERALQSLKSAL